MAKVLIDIPENMIDMCKWHKDGISPLTHLETDMLAESIKNGKLIPNHCGRLIDAKALEGVMYHEAFEVDSDMQRWDSGNWIRYRMFENAIHNAPTIIEAESKVSE